MPNLVNKRSFIEISCKVGKFYFYKEINARGAAGLTPGIYFFVITGKFNPLNFLFLFISFADVLKCSVNNQQLFQQNKERKVRNIIYGFHEEKIIFSIMTRIFVDRCSHVDS